MSALKKVMALVLAALPLLGCDRQVGTVPFTSEDSKSTTLPLAAGNVAFWTDLDVAYEGSATLSYQIELAQGGRTVATTRCDPLGKLPVQLGWVDTQRNALHSASGHGKMSCAATLAKAGPTVVRATLAFGVRPLTATINRADLVVKQ